MSNERLDSTQDSWEAQYAQFGISKESVLDIFTQIEDFRKKTLEAYPQDQSKQIIAALDLMVEVHAGQVRRPQNTPYAGHPLEVADRVTGILDKPEHEIVISALLHDSVEDQADKLAKKYQAENPANEELPSYQAALKYIESKFGTRVSKTVSSLSNPDFDVELSSVGVTEQHPEYTTRKNALYAQHVAEIVTDPDAFPIKLVDFLSNAGAVGQLPDSPQRTKLMTKYAPVVDIMSDALTTNSSNIKLDSRIAINDQLQKTKVFITQNLK